MYQVLISNIINQIPEDLHLKYLIPIKKPCLSTYMIDYNTPPMTRIRDEIWVILLQRFLMFDDVLFEFPRKTH